MCEYVCSFVGGMGSGYCRNTAVIVNRPILLVKNYGKSFFEIRVQNVWAMTFFFKSALNDYYSAC